MRYLSEYVVFDLETNADHPDPAQHEIIQIGAVVASITGEVVDEFDTYVRPERPLAANIRKLTGIKYGHLAAAPSLADALTEFCQFVADRPMVAHNGMAYDFEVLDASAASTGMSTPNSARLDTWQLAHIAFPRTGKGVIPNMDGSQPPTGRSLDALADFFGVAGRQNGRHDALADARITLNVLAAMLAELNQRTPARRLQRWILGLAEHPWAEFLNPQNEQVQLEDVIGEVEPLSPIRPSCNFDIAAIRQMFETGGAIMGNGRSPRRQQAEMAEKVSIAFGNRSTLLIEAPTGTGKTLAYLVPAVEMARASGAPTLVVPHSRVLQDQILETLEELKGILGPFSTVLLKGMNNYISLKALDTELAAFASEVDSRSSHSGDGLGESFDHNATQSSALALAVLCAWVAQTPTGDLTDLRTNLLENHLPVLAFLRWKLQIRISQGMAGRTRLERLDFYRRAREGVSKAHVAILNHALLVTAESPGSFNLLIDEAHNLEDSATGALSVETSTLELERLCDAIWDTKTRQGFTVRLSAATGWGLTDPKINAVRHAVNEVKHRVALLSDPLTEYLRDRTGINHEEAEAYGASYRIRRGADTHRASYEPTQRAGRALRDSLYALAYALNELVVPRQQDLQGRYRQDALEDELAWIGDESRSSAKLIDAVLWDEQLSQEELLPDDVSIDTYWINLAEIKFEMLTSSAKSSNRFAKTQRNISEANAVTDGIWRWALRRVPLSVSGHLRQLWRKSRSLVLTSATLQVNSSFSYLVGSLGLTGLGPQSEVLPSPFKDLADRHLVLLTDYLPAPRGQLMDRFTQATASEIPRLFVASDGDAMALMTARVRLDKVRDRARPLLSRLGITLLVQDEGSSPALIERMRSERGACLLALRSFWEGVDLPGDALRVLLIEKVPFDSPADPVVAARMERLERDSKDPFSEYMVPRAAIRLAQGAGRLIRTETDIGVTVMLDSRLRRGAPYRDVMRSSFIGSPRIEEVDTADHAYEALTEHLGLELDQERLKRIGSIPDDALLSQKFLDFRHSVSGELPDDQAIEEILEIARQGLGFEQWRPGQREVMTRFMRGSDVMAVLPTGSGKSATYQIPALALPGVTLVVSPLIALMRDQIETLRARGVTEAAALHAGVGQAEQRDILHSAARGHIKLLYVSPERLWSPPFRAQIASVDVQRIAVDEAHCISLWGHSFRTEYSKIPQAVEEITGGRVPVLAVTATATPEVRDDIVRLLNLTLDDEPVVGSADRPEIRYYLEKCTNLEDRDRRVVQILEAFRRQSAIIYVPKRADAERLSVLLRAFGHIIRPYHAGMPDTERRHTEDAFLHGEINVVVATKAFGLGIDKPDIALIVHLEMPASIEEYVQETGRAARGAIDGTGPPTGTAVLLVKPRDCRIHDYFVKQSIPDIRRIRKEWYSLQPGMNWVNPCEQSWSQSGSEFANIGSDAGVEQKALALHYLELSGTVRRLSDYVLKGKVNLFADSEKRLAQQRVKNPNWTYLCQRIVELVRQVGDEYQPHGWSQRLGCSIREVEEALFELQSMDIVGFSTWKYGWRIERFRATEPNWSKIGRAIKSRKAQVKQRSEDAKRWAHGPSECRRYDMLKHLGEGATNSSGSAEGGSAKGSGQKCGGCDTCTPDLPRPWDGVEISSEQVFESLNAEPTILAFLLSVEGVDFSRYKLVCTLVGIDRYLKKSLKMNGFFGRLKPLGVDKVTKVIDEMIADGLISEVEVYHTHRYKTLRLTETGKRFLE